MLTLIAMLATAVATIVLYEVAHRQGRRQALQHYRRRRAHVRWMKGHRERMRRYGIER